MMWNDEKEINHKNHYFQERRGTDFISTNDVKLVVTVKQDDISITLVINEHRRERLTDKKWKSLWKRIVQNPTMNNYGS